MRMTATFVASLALVALEQAGAADQKQTPIPDSCPVTRSTSENRFTPPPHEAAQRSDADGPMITCSRVNNAIMGKEVAMLTMLEFLERGAGR